LIFAVSLTDATISSALTGAEDGVADAAALAEGEDAAVAEVCTVFDNSKVGCAAGSMGAVCAPALALTKS
jgi:hypothetical protein